MTEDPTHRYLLPNRKTLHRKLCTRIKDKAFKLASGKELRYEPCSFCLKEEKKKAQKESKDSKEPALKRIPATTFASKWIYKKPNKRIIILVGDTEGQQFFKELSVMSLTDFFQAHYDITTPKEYRLEVKTGSVSIGQAFTLISEEIKQMVPEPHEVWFFFHNGKNHDFPLLRSVLKTEHKDYQFPSHFRFGDTIDLIRNVVNGFEGKWSETFVYATLFDEKLDYRKTKLLKAHTASYDTLQLRRICRFLAMWLFKSRSVIPGLMEARAKLVPEMPCGSALEMFESFIIEHVTTQPISEIHPKTKLQHKPVVRLAVHAGPNSKHLHIEKCCFTEKYKLPIVTDTKRLATMPFCQMCPFPEFDFESLPKLILKERKNV